MRISEKQLHIMITWLTTLVNNMSDEGISMVAISRESRKEVTDLLNEIINQQSDEVREIEDE